MMTNYVRMYYEEEFDVYTRHEQLLERIRYGNFKILLNFGSIHCTEKCRPRSEQHCFNDCVRQCVGICSNKDFDMYLHTENNN